MLKWFSHVERMREDRMVRRVLRACVEVNRKREGLSRWWMDMVKGFLIGRKLRERDEGLLVKDREP